MLSRSWSPSLSEGDIVVMDNLSAQMALAFETRSRVGAKRSTCHLQSAHFTVENGFSPSSRRVATQGRETISPHCWDPVGTTPDLFITSRMRQLLSHSRRYDPDLNRDAL